MATGDYYYTSTSATTSCAGPDLLYRYGSLETTSTASSSDTITWIQEPALEVAQGWDSAATTTAAHLTTNTYQGEWFYTDNGYGQVTHQRIFHDGEQETRDSILRQMQERSIQERRGIFEQMQVEMDAVAGPNQYMTAPTSEAEEKALKLLGEIIGEDELKVYKKTGRLFIKGVDGDYVARRGQTLQKIEGDKVVDLCVHIDGRLNCPATDNVIAMKFLLEDDPENVIRIANRVGESKLDEMPLAACM